MFGSSLDLIIKKKEKAFALFTQTRDDLIKTIDQAYDVIMDNDSKAAALQDESMLIKGHIYEMNKSLEQIESIIGGN